jgi:hypothetical protein
MMMNLEQFNFDSLVISPPEDKMYGVTKPPMPSASQNNLINIGPFTIQKLHIPEGFYTNPTSWSKSSTGSGHTEQDEDSYRIERETRLEYINNLNEFRNSPGSIHSPHVNINNLNTSSAGSLQMDRAPGYDPVLYHKLSPSNKVC